jgi:hypothetical protein
MRRHNIEVMEAAFPSSENRFTPRNVLRLALLFLAVAFFALHYIHLRADFPNHSPWMDWSKYTDEGWYGDGAIRHFQRGHWYVAGDFNPAVALPVWPLLESALFHFTGVSVTAARALTVAIFGLVLITAYLLISRSHRLSPDRISEARGPSLSAAIAVLLLAASPFCFVFFRLAILEPLLILLTLLALLTITFIQPPKNPAPSRAAHLLPSVCLGVLIPLTVLTKTTAIFLLPAVAWLLWARSGYRLRLFLRLSILPGAIAAGLWLGYYLILLRPHFLEDYRYLFSANAYTGITAATALTVLSDTIRDGIWIGALIFPLSLLSILLAFLNPRLSRRNPLIPSLILWAAGYFFFLAYHNNLQPRYYLVVAIPLTLLVPVVFADLSHIPSTRKPSSNPQSLLDTYPLGFTAITVALIVAILLDAQQTIQFVRTPEYSLVNAASQIEQTIAADRLRDPSHNPLVLSISGSQLSLMTGLPSICDDFGTLQLIDRVRTYRPGWFLTWNHVEDDKMEALAPFYHLHRVAEFPAMDDPERNLLILYRLDPPEPAKPQPATRQRKPIPRQLQTKLGQQPSVTQLQH